MSGRSTVLPVRQPTGPDELPQVLPGRWLVSLCASRNRGHTWIRFENMETGEVRSISRFHLLVGGWFDRDRLRWNYGPTWRTGLHMDRDQRFEADIQDGGIILLFTYLDDPPIYFGGGATGHGVVRNNCVSYTRDAWYFYTGELYDLPGIHSPTDLIRSIEARHPEIRGWGDR